MDSLDTDIVIHFASYLCSKDIINLALTCRRFGSSRLHDTGLSLMEETAYQIICNAKEDERNALPKLVHQSYIEVYSELEQHRAPRIFDQLIGDHFSYVNNDKSRIKLSIPKGNRNNTNTAICNHVMRAGRHYITFTREDENIGGGNFGIIRPLKNWNKKGMVSFNPQNPKLFGALQDERTVKWGESKINYCSLKVGIFNGNGRYCWSDWVRRHEARDWNGSEEFEVGDEIGMLLDLHAGTLTVYKNRRRLGIMKDGLTGEYCWVATIWAPDIDIRVEKGVIPTS